MNDVRPVLRDDLLLDRLALGERPDDAGTAEDLLLALRADSLLAVPRSDALASVPLATEREPVVGAPVPAPRVVRLRSTFAGALVAAGVLAGTSGVAAAVTGDPLAGLSGVRDAVLVVAQPEGHAPLLRSVDGARAHLEVERIAGLLAAGRVEDAQAAAAAMDSLLDGLAPNERDLLLAELDGTAPGLVDVAGLVEADEHPPGGVQPSGSDGVSDTPAVTATGPDGHGGPDKTPKPSKPPKPTAPPSSVPPVTPPVTLPAGSATAPPSSVPPATTPPPSTTTPPPPAGDGSPTTSAQRPGNGGGTGSPSDPGGPTKTPKPTKPPKP